MSLLSVIAAFLLGTGTGPGAGAPSRGAIGHDGPWARFVRDSVAQRWGVDPERIVLEWDASGLACEEDPDATVTLLGTGAAGYWVVSVGCGGEPEQRVRARAGVRVDRPVAARDLGRDETLAAADIRTEARLQWGPPEASADPVVEGWVTRSAIPEGRVLERPAVSPPIAVRSGQTVEAIWRRNGIQLALEVRAVGSGSAGEPIYVRTHSGERLRGTVVAPGRVALDSGEATNR